MIEIPEAQVLSLQLNTYVKGKTITDVITAKTPHKLTWFAGNPQEYRHYLLGKTIGESQAIGGQIEITVNEYRITFGDGVNLRHFSDKKDIPEKHQLLLELNDSEFLIAAVQMYGGICCFRSGEFDNKYYLMAKSKPSVMSADFSEDYFKTIINEESVQKLTAKAFLATEQRIPGLGNGVLQDILYAAKIHPKTKVSSLNDNTKTKLFSAIKDTIQEMVLAGGRDTEKDLLGNSGKYITKMSKNTADTNCPVCGELIKKENYMGGSIYFCSGCQKT